MPSRIQVPYSRVMSHEITLPDGKRCEIGELNAEAFDDFVVAVCQVLASSANHCELLKTRAFDGVERDTWSQYDRWLAVNELYEHPGVKQRWHSLFVSLEEVKS